MGGRGWRANVTAMPFLAPALVFLVVFLLAPTLLSIFWGGTDKSLTTSHFQWTGLANVREALGDDQVAKATRNTLLVVLVSVPLSIAIAIGLASLVSRITRGRAVVRLLLFLPVTANLVAMSVVFQYVFSPDSTGLANNFLSVFGVAPIDWLGSPTTALLVVGSVGLWRLTSLVFVLYLAGFTAIPGSVDEAAEVDGVRGWVRFRKITWPLLAPTTVFAAVVGAVLSLQTFETVAVLTQGGPNGASETLVYRIFLIGFRPSFRVGYANILSSLLIAVAIIVGILGSLGGRRFGRTGAAG
ncbi:MAG: multiple sugar transport system permease protein [Frankiaceae bacterium]|nr:multiple sugar transport system permease protein [Frankiaceae bacterium]